MDLLNIPSLITIGDGQGGNAISSVGEYLRKLISANSIASFISHKVEMYGQPSTGAVRVRIPRYLKSFAYKQLGGNKTQEMQVGEIVVSIDKMEMIKTSVDEFDLMRFKESGAYQAEVLASVAKTIIAELNAQFYKLVAETLKVNKQNVIELDLCSLATSQTDLNKFRFNAYQYVQFLNNSKKVFNDIQYSLETSDVLSVIDSIAQNNLVYAFTTGSAGDKSIDIQVQGSNIVGKQLGGLDYVVDNMCINNVIAMGQSFSGDNEYDFRNNCVLSIFAGAVAFNYYIKSMVSTLDPDTLNPIIASKYMYGGKVILPNLVWGAVKDATDYEYNLDNAGVRLLKTKETATEIKYEIVSTDATIPLSELGTFSVVSSDTGVGTVVVAQNVATLTKVANGTTNLTLSSDNPKVKGEVREVIITNK